MKRMLVVFGTLSILTLGALTWSSADAAPPGPPDKAVIDFGLFPAEQADKEGTHPPGSPFPPGSGHDSSNHARDSMRPRTVVISAGGSVDFGIGPFHRAAIYEPGITAEMIDLSNLVDMTSPFFIPGFTIDDPNGRLAISDSELATLSLQPQVWTSPAGVFDSPGTYLVICTTVPHFVDNDMYGWVIVK